MLGNLSKIQGDAPSEGRDVSAPSRTESQIAVVGMACRFPGARHYRQFWDNLVAGRSSIRRVPSDRWTDFRLEKRGGAPALIPWCGMLDNIETFDHEFFNISAREARSMDPQQRLLLQEAWHCVEDGGITLPELRAGGAGVWVGVMANDYHQAAVAPDVEVDSYAALGSYDCILANRISYNFGLNGPSLSVGAACASSNVALHLAKQSMLSGECGYAFVAGVNLNFHSWKNTSFARSHMLSPDGRCKTFDQSANGYVPGEGIAVLLLQPLEDALRAGHPIHGLIAGTAVNHTGAGPMIAAPRVEAQAEVVRAAFADAEIGPEAISYVEAHGTGTSLGDPIELAGLQSAFHSAGIRAQSCHIGSVKTNIGHLEAAAGLAGVIKTLLMMRHGVIAPTLNIETSNGLIDFTNSPFTPATESVPWRSDDVRRAGVSSFGFGGANSHVIIEEFVPSGDVRLKDDMSSPLPFILSAKSREALGKLGGQWLDLIESGKGDSSNLPSICRTLSVGREHLPFRCGGMVQNEGDIRCLLEAAEYRSEGDASEWSLVFGEFGFSGIEAVRRYFLAAPQFIDRVRQVLVQMEEAGVSGLVSGFDLDFWGGAQRGYIDAAIALAIVDLLNETGVCVGEICHGSGSAYPALAACGCWSINELVAAIRSEEMLVTGRPRLTFVDLVSGGRLSPIEVHPDYFSRVASFNTDSVGLDELLITARQLGGHQLTYKKYFGEWVERSITYGFDLPSLLDGFSAANPVQKRVVAVACFHCLSRLREKWQLPEPELVISAELREIVALLRNDLLKIDEVLELLSGKADKLVLSEQLNQILSARKCDESLPLLASMSPDPQFKIRRDARPGGLSEWVPQSRALAFGTIAPSLNPQVSFDMGDASSTCLIESFVHLWLHGTEVDWDRFFPRGTFVMQRLPDYPFGGKPFWLKKRSDAAMEKPSEGGGEAKSEEECRWTFSIGEPVVGDHLIGEQYLIPAAAMVDLGIVCAGLSTEAPNYSIEDFRVLEPCVVTNACVVSGHAAGKSVGSFELRECGRVVSRGRVRKTSEKPPRESVPHFLGEGSRPASLVYSELAEIGYHYGPFLRPIIRVGQGQSFWAELGGAEDWSDGRRVSPRLLDGVFQVGLLAVMRHGASVPRGSLWVPCGFASCRIRSGICGSLFVRESQHYILPNGDAIVSLVGVSESGEVQIEIKDLILKVVRIDFGQGDQLANSGLRFVPEWQAVPVRSEGVTTDISLVLYGREGERSEFDGIYSQVLRFNYRLSDDWPTMIREALHKHQELSRIYWIPPRFDLPADGDQLSSAIEEHVVPFFDFCQVMAALKGRSIEIVILTESNIDIVGTEVASFPLYALLLGLGKTLSREHNHCRFLSADLDDGLPSEQMAAVAGSPAFDSIGESCWRGEMEYRKVLKLDSSARSSLAPFQQQDVFLIAGGLGGVGRELAEFLNVKYRGRLVLLGRSRPSKSQETLLRKLQQDGADVQYLQCDLDDEEAVGGAIAETASKFGRIDGLFHVAGSLMDSRLLKMKSKHFRQGISAKVNGIFNLYQALRQLTHPVKAFVQFSSVLSSVGNAGQSSYIAACCFQDHFNAYLRSKQLPAQVINFGRWEDAGSVTGEYHQQVLDEQGVLGIKSAEALAELDRVLAGNLKQVIVARLAEWKQKELTMERGVTFAVESPLAIKSNTVERRSEVIMSSGRNRSKVLKVLQDSLTGILESEVSDPDLVLKEQGVDSIMGVEFVTAVNQALDISLNATGLYDYPTLNRLADHILEEYDVCEADSDPNVESKLERMRVGESSPLSANSGDAVLGTDSKTESTVSSVETESADDIAIIGMSARYPDADSIDEFWENLRAGKKCLREVPEDHWGAEWFSADPEAKNRSVCKWGGFVRDSDRFDSLFFNISPADAAWMDPQQRIILQESWRAFENAGYTPEMLSESRCGAMIGVMSNDYQEVISSDRDRTLQAAELVGNSNAILSARISYALNLWGPSMAVDTACSSSLVALHYASNALRSGDANMMLVGGVTLYRSPMYYVRMSKAGMLSPTGRCWTFDERADGYVPGEGCGVLVLKRLPDALRDGDHIHAVIKGSALNQDGKTNGITAPSSESQKSLLCDVYRRWGIDPQSLGLLEAHGTGTKLGDPIEFNALTKAFREFTSAREFCAIGSVKANIGHTLAAAGLAGVIKAVLSLQHHERVPLISYDSLNSHIDAAGSPFYIPTELQKWPQPPDGIPRRAGVSSFGFSGTNAHVILEESPLNSSRQIGEDQSVMIALSARDETVLKRKVSELREWWSRYSDNYSLAALAATLLYRRSHYAYRLAFVVSDREDLHEQLKRLDGVDLSETEFFSEVRGNKVERQEALGEIAATLLEQLDENGALAFSPEERKTKLGAVAELYRQGLDMGAVRTSRAYPVVPLPGYPFVGRSFDLPVDQKPFKTAETDAIDGLYFHEPIWQGAPLEGGSQDAAFPVLLVNAPSADTISVSREVCRINWDVDVMPVSDAAIETFRSNSSFQRYMKRLKAIEGRPAEMIVYGSVDPCQRMLHSVGALVQCLSRVLGHRPVRLLYVYPTTNGLVDSEHAALSGLARTLSHELPQIKLKVLAYGSDKHKYQELFEELSAEPFVGELRCHDQLREVRRFTRLLPDEVELSPVDYSNAVILITGGLGG